ncbi:MAG: hypothetical protein WDO68_25915 [Gammaproteobacteria bacterium]
MSSDAPAISLSDSRPRAGAGPGFFFIAHIALLAVVLVGFSPTFYLRGFFRVPAIPPSLYVHGAVLTLWFLLTVLQGWLIRTRRPRLHRRLGYVAAGYAALVIVLGLVANQLMGSQIKSPAEAENIIYWANLFTLVQFAVFVSLAVVFRGSPEAHKRLTLLASISIVGPALARFPMWPMFAGGTDAARNYGIGGLLLLFAAMIVYDLIVRRRPHPATWLGAVGILVGLAGAVFLGVTGKGFEILHGPVASVAS